MNDKTITALAREYAGEVRNLITSLKLKTNAF